MKQNPNKTPLALVTLAACLALSGCASPKIEARVKAGNQEVIDNSRPAVSSEGIGKNAGKMVAGGSADADQRAQEQAAQVVLRRASKPWVASVSVPMGAGEKLPSVFQEPVKLNFSDARSGGKVSLRVVAERITAATGVPVRIKPDVFSSGGTSQGMAPPMPASASGGGVPPPVPGVPPGATPGSAAMSSTQFAGVPRASSVAKDPSLDGFSMRWNGSLEGYLNHITDLTNLSWEYRDGVVVIERFRTEFFEIAFLDSETSYSMGMNASDQGSTGSSGGANISGGSSTSNASVDVSEKGKSNVVSTILSAINQVIRDVPGSSAVRSDGSGRIAVTTTKETMTKVRDFVRAENESLLRQAQVQFDIYSVRTLESNERGISWDAVLNSLSDGISTKIRTPQSVVDPKTAGSIGFSVIDPSSRSARFGNSNAILQLLNQYGTATQHRPISLLTLNRQWARKASLGSKAYVSETTPAPTSIAGGGGGTPGLKTATITTGDRYLAQPYVMDNNTVVLKFGIGLSSLVELKDFTSGQGPFEQKVQTPETTNIIDQSTIALKTGQVLVITGMSRIVASERTNTLTEDASVGAGGSKKVIREREDFIIFVRPTIL
jgi:type IVB pilus formation R64 PilN family outer membrane protein